MLVKERSETLLKIVLYVENFSKTSRQTVIFRTHILMSCVSNSKYGYTDMKTINSEENQNTEI